MICNAFDLSHAQRLEIAARISILSHENNSSLLPKSIPDVISIINSGDIFIEVKDDEPLFSVAFEPTGNDLFVEIGATCNLAPEKIRGKEIFPQIVDKFCSINGNGKKSLYLTTTDIRMAKVAKKSGLILISNVGDYFPPDVLKFCCSPCSLEKTGAIDLAQQLNSCPRFRGIFIPKFGKKYTRQPCQIYGKIM
ncbi:MAG: hypothetical protein ACD_7C00360G0004 [uncultured bacterium]|nr:MAG: hypothetical protein ACD_7C00360G0004 [uncultured bacterium]